MLDHALFCLVAAIFLVCATVSSQAADAGMVVAGKARFTVITPNCIRMEYSEDGQFVDQRSLFAVGRSARFPGCAMKQKDGSVSLDTGDIRLTYTPDGQPFSPSNLQATIKLSTGKAKGDSQWTLWKPGMKNAHNLGGTAGSLDGWDGARPLDDGLLSRDGWFLYDDSLGPLLTSDWIDIRPQTAGTDWYLFGYGYDYKAALKSLAAIGGPVPLPRRYALGVWYSRYWPYSSSDYRQIVKEYADHDFPLDIVVMDMDWHTEHWTSWSWNRKLLPDAEDLLQWLHHEGLAVSLNVHTTRGVGPDEDAYVPFMRDMGEDPTSGKTIPFETENKKFIDSLFKDLHEPLEKEGVDFWWLDSQQNLYTKSIPGLTNIAWLNPCYYQHTARNGKRGISFSRWAGWGDHRNPIHFSGDSSTSWKMLAFEIPFNSTAGNVGCFFWSHDIGGHIGARNEESYTRWCQFGALTAALRSHSTRDAVLDRRPWTYPKWAEDSMRRSLHLHSELFPYIYSSVWQSCRETIPLSRPMYLAYPREDKAYHSPQQYFLGDNLLSAPIVSPGVGPSRVGTQVVWFPGGLWYNYFTGERYTDKGEALVAADINEFPFYVRGGVPLPMQPYTPRMATTPQSTLVVRCYPGDDGKTGRFTLHEDDGITTDYTQGRFATTKLSYTRRGDRVTVTVSPTTGKYDGQLPERDYIVELPCTLRASAVKVNGKPARSEYDRATLTNRILVPAGSIRNGVTVAATVKPADFEQIRVRAILRRAGITASKASYKGVNELIAAVPGMKLDSQSANILLSAAGFGCVSRNEAGNLYPNQEKTYLFVPRNLIDRATLIWSVEDHDGDRVRVLDQSEGVRISGPITRFPPSLEEATKRGPWAGIDGYRVVRADVRLGGRSFTVYGPRIRWDLTNLREDIARTAIATVSSVQEGSSSQGAIDGVTNSNLNEWASNGEGAGAWIRLDWDKEQTVDRVWLFDRPNTTDHVTSGELTFSDGTTMVVGALPNDASDGVEVNFPAKKVTWVKFSITGVGPTTENAGISEIAVFRKD